MIARLFLFFFSYLGLISLTSAATVSPIFSSGDPQNRIDIVVVSEGYTDAEISKFNSDVNTLINGFFSREGVFIDYKSYFNVRSLFEASVESGATHQEVAPPIIRNTAFGAFYGCQGIPRLICIDFNRVRLAVTSVLLPNQSDYMMVLVNDPTFGGSGGSITVFSTHPESIDGMLHEFGHSHGLLADEYTMNPPSCSLFEPTAANATMQTTRNQIKWNHWIADSTSIPTTDPQIGVPGLYEGARYCVLGMYRPTINSRMRHNSAPYEQINNEQMVRRFYNFVSPIDAIEPLQNTLTLPRGVVSNFNVTPLQPTQHSLSVAWHVDGVPVASGNNFVLDTNTLNEGAHSIRATVRDETNWVRSDPATLTSDSQEWIVTITDNNPLTLSSNDASLGSVNVGETKPGESAITLANSGIGPITINNIQLIGADASQFSMTSTCGALPMQLASGGNCSITPIFNPNSTGAMSATISISHDSAENPETINLSGVGVDFAITGEATTSAPGTIRFIVTLSTMAGPTINPTMFTTTGNPPDTTITFDPPTIPASTTTGSTVMTVTQITPSLSTTSTGPKAALWLFTLTLFGTIKFVSTKKTTSRKTGLQSIRGILIALLLITILPMGCGDKGGANGGGPQQNTPDTSTITITATSGSVSRTTQVTY